MPSIFYNEHVLHKIPLTGLFLECLGLKISEVGAEAGETEIFIAISEALKEARLVEEPAEKDIVYIAEEIGKCYEKVDKDVKKLPDSKGKYFAGYFAEWASGLSYDKLCFYVAGFDYAKAKEYYETRDQRSIVALADEKLRLDFELARVSFEAALFGFGGSYKDTPKEGDAIFDLSADGESAERALKKLGF